MSFFGELQKRNVLKTAAAYIVVAWVIVEAAATLQEIFGFHIWIVQALTTLLAIGLLPVLLFSWFYQLTPQGIVRDDGLDQDRSFSDAAGRKLIYITIGFAILGVALIVGTRPAGPPEPTQAVQSESPDPLSVAVLPFRNMSGAEENEYLSEGLTETLLHMLAQVDKLKVMARTSSFAFKGRDMDIREIATSLGVANILEGSVQRYGDRVRVTAQLIRADDGTHLWSRNYDRELTDVFAIQDEVASDVGITLLGTLLNPGDVVRPRGVDTDNFAAYDLYLQARSERHKGSFVALQKAESLLLAALDEDPEFVDARVERASLIIEMGDTGLEPQDESVVRAGKLLEEILQEHPDHSTARMLHLICRSLLLRLAGDFKLVPGLLQEARVLHANVRHDVETSMNFTEIVRAFGDRETAIALLDDALEIDPLNPALHLAIGTAYESVGNHARAKEAYQRCVELEPEAPNAWMALGLEGTHLGDGALAIESLLRAVDLDPLDPELPGSAATFLYDLGMVDEARRYHDRVLQLAPESEEAQNLEIREALARDDLESALQLSRTALQYGAGQRRSAWHPAWRTIFHTSVRRGTEAEDITFYDQYFPGFADIEQIEVPGRINAVRANALDVFLAVHPHADVDRMSTRIGDHYRQAGMREGDLPLVRLDVLLLFSPLEEAVEWALEQVFSQPPTAFYGQWMWRLRFSRPFMAPLFDDPRVRQALEHWEAEEAQFRDDIKARLQARAAESE